MGKDMEEKLSKINDEELENVSGGMFVSDVLKRDAIVYRLLEDKLILTNEILQSGTRVSPTNEILQSGTRVSLYNGSKKGHVIGQGREITLRRVVGRPNGWIDKNCI